MDTPENVPSRRGNPEEPPQETVGWVLVGAGWVARDHMVPALAASPTSRVVAVLDRDADAARNLAARLPGARACTDPAQAFATPGARAAYIATPNHTHRALVEAAAAAGLAVLCEKPLAPTPADAAACVEACERAGVLAATAFDQRYHPAHRAVARSVAEGLVGEVTSVRIVYGCWLPPGWSPPGSTTGDNWRVDPARAGGGAYIDLAPHGLDLVGVLLGEDVEQATAYLQHKVHDYAVDDGSVLVGRTPSGVLVSIANSYNTVETLPRRRLEVVGTRGQLVATDTMGQTPGGHLEFLDAATGERRDVGFDGLLSPFLGQVRAFEEALGEPARWPFPLDRDLRLLTVLSDAARAGATAPNHELNLPSNQEVPS